MNVWLYIITVNKMLKNILKKVKFNKKYYFILKCLIKDCKKYF